MTNAENRAINAISFVVLLHLQKTGKELDNGGIELSLRIAAVLESLNLPIRDKLLAAISMANIFVEGDVEGVVEYTADKLSKSNVDLSNITSTEPGKLEEYISVLASTFESENQDEEEEISVTHN